MSSKTANFLTCVPGAGHHNKDAARCDLCTVLNYTVCGALTPEELARFGASSRTLRVSEGATLLHDGDVERYVFSVTSGCLKSFKQLADGRRQVTGFYFPGDFIGLAQSDTYLAEVEAVIDSDVCRMLRSDLNQLSSEIPNLEHRLHELTSAALVDMQGQIVLLGRKTARERVASFLLMLSKRAYQRGVTANPVSIPMIREDIADFLGLTTETVSRTFSTLRKLGFIGPDADKKIDILDRAALERVADGF